MSENIPQAILTRQGRKALGGNTEDLSDVEVRRRGVKPFILKAGALAAAAVIAAGGAVYGLRKTDEVNASQAQQNHKVFEGTVFGDHPKGGDGSAPKSDTGSTEAAPTATLTPDQEIAATSTSVTAPSSVTAPAATESAPIPAEGAWTPTPGATSSPEAEATASQQVAPVTGGVAPEHTGGIQAK